MNRTSSADEDFTDWLSQIQQRVAGQVAGQGEHHILPDRELSWKRRRLVGALRELVHWSKYDALPVPYSCNDWSVWPTTTRGLSSPADRVDKTGCNELLDTIVRSARRDRPGGGRFEVMGDGAYWIESGRCFLTWKYVDLANF